MTFSLADIADALETGIHQKLTALDVEQAVYGLDSYDELKLHDVLTDSLLNAGFGVHQEVRYPSDRFKRKITDGERCDFVLTHDGRELVKEETKGTLFDPPDAVPLDEAFWLEMKVVTQFTVNGPNQNYSSQLLSTVRTDIAKLSKETGILHAGLLIVLFAEDIDVTTHDLNVWMEKCVERGLPVGAPAVRNIIITNRHGNNLCAVAVYPISHV